MCIRIVVLDVHAAVHLVEQRHQKATRVDCGSSNWQQIWARGSTFGTVVLILNQFISHLNYDDPYVCIPVMFLREYSEPFEPWSAHIIVGTWFTSRRKCFTQILQSKNWMLSLAHPQIYLIKFNSVSPTYTYTCNHQIFTQRAQISHWNIEMHQHILP